MAAGGGRIETREAILIAFFAAFLVAARAALRWHIHVPGHATLAIAFGLVLVGGHGCYQTLTRYRALSSRVASWAEITPIPASEVVELIRGFHPLLADADEELLDEIDDLYAHGVLRNWATFVKRAQPLCAKLDLDTVDEHVARNVYAQKPLEQAA